MRFRITDFFSVYMDIETKIFNQDIDSLLFSYGGNFVNVQQKIKKEFIKTICLN